MILNMISTTVMIKLGKVYRNQMIDVKPTNKKLVERSKRIIMSCTNCTREIAEKAFIESGQDVRISIFMILSSGTKEESIKKLKENDNNISKAMKTIY